MENISQQYNDNVARSGSTKGFLVGLIVGTAFATLQTINPSWTDNPEQLGGFALGSLALALYGSHTIFKKDATYAATKYAITHYQAATIGSAAASAYLLERFLG
jgi:hypothetical protein